MKTKLLTLLIGLSCFVAMAEPWLITNGPYRSVCITNGIYYPDFDVPAMGRVFVNHDSGAATNLVVSTNYTGTITVGQDCFTVNELKSFAWQKEFADLHHLDIQVAYLEGAQNALRLASKSSRSNFFTVEIETNILAKMP